MLRPSASVRSLASASSGTGTGSRFHEMLDDPPPMPAGDVDAPRESDAARADDLAHPRPSDVSLSRPSDVSLSRPSFDPSRPSLDPSRPSFDPARPSIDVSHPDPSRPSDVASRPSDVTSYPSLDSRSLDDSRASTDTARPALIENATFFGSERSHSAMRLLARRPPGARSRTRVLSVEHALAEEHPATTPSPVKRKATVEEEEDAGAARPKTPPPPSAFPGAAPRRSSKRIKLSVPADASGPPSQKSSPPRPTSPSARPHTPTPAPPPPAHLGSPRGRAHSHAHARSQSATSLPLSARSLPVRAIMSPRPPSVSTHAGSVYRMRDPRRAARPVGWAPAGGGWRALAFWAGFVLFPLWWAAALASVQPYPERLPPRPRAAEAEEKEARRAEEERVFARWREARDQRAWRARCRVVGALALLLYVPLIVLAAVFGPHAHRTVQ